MTAETADKRVKIPGERLYQPDGHRRRGCGSAERGGGAAAEYPAGPVDEAALHRRGPRVPFSHGGLLPAGEKPAEHCAHCGRRLAARLI